MVYRKSLLRIFLYVPFVPVGKSLTSFAAKSALADLRTSVYDGGLISDKVSKKRETPDGVSLFLVTRGRIELPLPP